MKTKTYEEAFGMRKREDFIESVASNIDSISKAKRQIEIDRTVIHQLSAGIVCILVEAGRLDLLQMNTGKVKKLIKEAM